MDTSTEAMAARSPRVVVGIDGSPGSRGALDWAMERAAATGSTVEALTAFAVDVYWADPYLADPRRIEAIKADTRARATEMIDEARSTRLETGRPVPDVDIVVVPGPAAQQLVEQSHGAEVLVVGSRGRGGVASTLLGSVALHCSAHARCPVVVIHPTSPESEPRVVAGLDDSEMSRAALKRAADEAILLGARLEVVVAFPPSDAWSELYEAVPRSERETPEQAESRARQMVSQVLGEHAERLETRVVVEVGVPGDVLVRAADGARLLVVGSRSRSRLEGMVLGSVALHCVVQARCPVMIVHPQRHSEDAPVTADANVAAAPAPAPAGQ